MDSVATLAHGFFSKMISLENKTLKMDLVAVNPGLDLKTVCVSQKSANSIAYRGYVVRQDVGTLRGNDSVLYFKQSNSLCAIENAHLEANHGCCCKRVCGAAAAGPILILLSLFFP